MRHIKKYNDDIENLEDYLQEFFDIFRITSALGDSKTFSGNRTYSIDDSVSNNFSGKIIIYVDERGNPLINTMDAIESMMNMLIRIKPNIEKRLKHNIVIKENVYNIGIISISIVK